MNIETLSVVLSILVAASALIVQLQRFLIQTREYMVELRKQNELSNALAAATLEKMPTP